MSLPMTEEGTSVASSNGNPPKQNDRHCDDNKVMASASEDRIHLKQKLKLHLSFTFKKSE